MRNEKGVTLIALVIAIILILVISGMMGYYTNNVFKIQTIKNLYNDIEQLEGKVNDYYLNNNSLPITEYEYTFSNSKNVNDNNKYYVIDLNKMKDIDLNFGRDLDKIKSSEFSGNIQDYKDLYIINEQSKTIYYVEGKNYENKLYYTISRDYALINI